MKIYVFPPWYPKNELDRESSYFREQVEALSERGHEVTVINIKAISVSRIGKQKMITKNVWQDGNVKTINYEVIIPIVGKLNKLQDKYISDIYYKIIKNQIDDDIANGLKAPDIMHAHFSHCCAYYCLKAKEKLNIPLVVTEHYSGLLLGTATENDYERVKKTIEQSDAFIFVGTNLQKKVCDKLDVKKNTYFIPNLVDTGNFYINENKQNEDEFHFLSACGLKKNKSIDLVIRAFHNTFSKEEKVNLLIAGDGVEREKLENLVKEFDETDRIKFFGRYSKEQSKEIFADADAFVLTSEVETFGIVYIEALSSGVPCIATKGQGAEDIIDDSNGIKVEYGNLDELSNAMRYIYENHDKYDKKKLREDCINRFSKDTICKQIEEVYQKVLN